MACEIHGAVFHRQTDLAHKNHINATHIYNDLLQKKTTTTSCLIDTNYISSRLHPPQPPPAPSASTPPNIMPITETKKQDDAYSTGRSTRVYLFFSKNTSSSKLCGERTPTLSPPCHTTTNLPLCVVTPHTHLDPDRLTRSRHDEARARCAPHHTLFNITPQQYS